VDKLNPFLQNSKIFKMLESEQIPERTIDPLQEMLYRQSLFISKWVDLSKLDWGSPSHQKWVLDYIGHAIEELCELRRHFPIRKHWKSQDTLVDREKVLDEYADVLHFIINIGLGLQLFESDDLYRIYRTKHLINIERQNSGY